MEQMHATYQALKATTERLYTDIRSKEQESAVVKVRPALDAALRALEDHLGITKAQKEALERKQEEDAPVIEAKTGEPHTLTQSPGDIAAAVTEKASKEAAENKASKESSNQKTDQGPSEESPSVNIPEA